MPRASSNKGNPTNTDRRRLGNEAESAALRYLESRGLIPVTRNFRCSGGEIDLVMMEGPRLVFIEVRYRRSGLYGGAAASVDRRKQCRILVAAELFLQTHQALEFDETRFDVVAVSGDPADLRLEWIPDTFQVAD